MHVNDKLLKYCEFYTKHLIEHRVESTLIFIKTTLFITSRQIQSATRNKMGTSAIPNFVSH